MGDPSGKTEMRQILTTAESMGSGSPGKRPIVRFIDFWHDKALLVNNAEWLTRIQYIPFLRDYGRHFSVNRMIKAESYRMRLESEEGLSFIEFNYMLLQAYDFLELFRRYQCRIQMGGSDQWGNIVAGIDLVEKNRTIGRIRYHVPSDHDQYRRQNGKNSRRRSMAGCQANQPL